jgi:hypothetical protein
MEIKRNRDSIFAQLDIRDPKEAFQNAINRGLKNPEDYMYMYTDKGRDYFKNICTRNYISFRRKASFIDKLKELMKPLKKA